MEGHATGCLLGVDVGCFVGFVLGCTEGCNDGIELQFEIDLCLWWYLIEQCPGSLLIVPMREVLSDPLGEDHPLPAGPERH